MSTPKESPSQTSIQGWMVAKKKGIDDDRIARDKRVALLQRRRTVVAKKRCGTDGSSVAVPREIKNIKQPVVTKRNKATTIKRRKGPMTSEDRARIRQQELIHQIRSLVHHTNSTRDCQDAASIDTKKCSNNNKPKQVVTPEHEKEPDSSQHDQMGGRNQGRPMATNKMPSKPTRTSPRRSCTKDVSSSYEEGGRNLERRCTTSQQRQKPQLEKKLVSPQKRRTRKTSLDIHYFPSQQRHHWEIDRNHQSSAKRKLIFQTIKPNRHNKRKKSCNIPRRTCVHSGSNSSNNSQDQNPCSMLTVSTDFETSARLVLESQRRKWNITRPNENNDKEPSGKTSEEEIQEPERKGDFPHFLPAAEPNRCKIGKSRVMSNRGIMLLSSSQSFIDTRVDNKKDSVTGSTVKDESQQMSGDTTSKPVESEIIERKRDQDASMADARYKDPPIETENEKTLPRQSLGSSTSSEDAIQTQEECSSPQLQQLSQKEGSLSPESDTAHDFESSTLINTQASGKQQERVEGVDFSSFSSCGLQSQPDHERCLMAARKPVERPSKSRKKDRTMLTQQPSIEEESKTSSFADSVRKQEEEVLEPASEPGPSLLSLPWHGNESSQKSTASGDCVRGKMSMETQVSQQQKSRVSHGNRNESILDPTVDLSYWTQKMSRTNCKTGVEQGDVPSFQNALAAIIVAKNRILSKHSNGPDGFLWLPSILEGDRN
ncbi:hypothetical protein IV203_026936 [Nitzschia inconspicua]|uniref:Uncharacterized protein n=1 Tax=Nitzschia inconspicua TaxID=303405 RepID=A0A9K3LJK7_9STRA|nr:hypothetical protein IV203_026936 [Nitzschia inconspicua]